MGKRCHVHVFQGTLASALAYTIESLGDFMVTMYLAYYTRDSLAKVASDPGNSRDIDHMDDGLIGVIQRTEASI
jgi:hypothetical protein